MSPITTYDALYTSAPLIDDEDAEEVEATASEDQEDEVEQLDAMILAGLIAP